MKPLVYRGAVVVAPAGCVMHEYGDQVDWDVYALNNGHIFSEDGDLSFYYNRKWGHVDTAFHVNLDRYDVQGGIDYMMRVEEYRRGSRKRRRLFGL